MVVVVKDIINLCFEFKGIFGGCVFGGCFCVMVPGGGVGGTQLIYPSFFSFFCTPPVYFFTPLETQNASG